MTPPYALYNQGRLVGVVEHKTLDVIVFYGQYVDKNTAEKLRGDLQARKGRIKPSKPSDKNIRDYNK